MPRHRRRLDQEGEQESPKGKVLQLLFPSPEHSRCDHALDIHDGHTRRSRHRGVLHPNRDDREQHQERSAKQHRKITRSRSLSIPSTPAENQHRHRHKAQLEEDVEQNQVQSRKNAK